MNSAEMLLIALLLILVCSYVAVLLHPVGWRRAPPDPPDPPVGLPPARALPPQAVKNAGRWPIIVDRDPPP